MSFRDSLPSFLSHPYYGLLMGVVTFVSLPLSIFLYFQAQETRDLVFTVHPVRTIIARAGGLSELKVEFKGETIKADVVGARIALWNEGKKSIHAADILSPLEIQLNPPSPILQASAVKASRGVIALMLGNDADMLRQGRMRVSFKILEHGDGGSIQVIYAGPPDVNFSLVGVVEGVGAPRSLRSSRESSAELAPSRLDRFAARFPWVVGAVFLLIMVPLVSLTVFRREGESRTTSEIVRNILVFVILFAGALILVFALQQMATPPFDF